MCSTSFPKEFEKTTEVLPFTKYGLSSIQEFQEAEKDIQHLEWLRKAGLTEDEIKLYNENEGRQAQSQKIESNVKKEMLKAIYSKLTKLHNDVKNCDEEEQASTSTHISNQAPLNFYPEGHPMNNIKDIEENLFGHLRNDILPITKRRKILRRLERRKERIDKECINIGTVPNTNKIDRPGSLWDVKEMPNKEVKQKTIGPKKPTLYSIKDNRIVRLESVNQEKREYRAVDIVMPINNAEVQLLEGTKMTVDDIKKINRFKDYEPGKPSKTLYLKNIAPSVSQQQLSLLFNQFVLANRGTIDVRLMTGRMRGQAFVSFINEDLAIQALDEINGTVLSGRPIIAVFGRNTNRIQDNT